MKKKWEVKELVIGGILGIFIGILLIYAGYRGISLVNMSVLFILFFILQIALHELGHLIGGLLSRYTFFSYRLFSLLIYKEDGKLKTTRQKVPGTLGQCLMIPNEGEFSFKLYLAGGVLMNLVISVFSLIFFPLYPVHVLEFVLIGFFFAASNWIPNGFNDGSTYKIAMSSKKYETIFYRQLHVNAKLAAGYTFSDLPPNYFYKELDEMEEINYFDDFQSFLELGLFLENREWKKMSQVLETLWSRREDMILPYQLELKKEMLSFLLQFDLEDLRIKEIMADKQLINYLKMKIISNYRVNAVIEYYYFKRVEEALILIKEGLSLKNKTSHLGEYLIESSILNELKRKIENDHLENFS